MAYKFQLGDFVASGSITAEDELTGSNLYVSSTSQMVGGLRLEGALTMDNVSISDGGAIAGATTISCSSDLSVGGDLNINNGDIDGSSASGEFAINMKDNASEAFMIRVNGDKNFVTFKTDNSDERFTSDVAFYASSTVNATGLASLDGGIDVNGTMTVSTAGAIAGATTISGSGAISGLSLDIEKGADFNAGGLTNAGAIAGITTADASGLASLDGGIDVNGSNFTAGTDGAVTMTSLSVQTGDIGAFANISGSGTAQFGGNTFLGAALNVTGAITAASTVHATGEISGAVGVEGLTMEAGNGNFTVGSLGAISGAAGADVMGTVDVDGALNVSSGFGLSGSGLVTAHSMSLGQGNLFVSSLGVLSSSAGTNLNVGGSLVVGNIDQAGVGDRQVASAEIIVHGSYGELAVVSWANFLTGVVGSGITAASGKLSTQGSSFDALADTDAAGADLAEGYNVFTGSISAAKSYKLPIPSQGDVVHVKAAGNAGTYSVTITGSSLSGSIDGREGSIALVTLESDSAAVSLIAANTTGDWFIL